VGVNTHGTLFYDRIHLFGLVEADSIATGNRLLHFVVNGCISRVRRTHSARKALALRGSR